MRLQSKHDAMLPRKAAKVYCTDGWQNQIQKIIYVFFFNGSTVIVEWGEYSQLKLYLQVNTTFITNQ